jgi:hypothetical protein
MDDDPFADISCDNSMVNTSANLLSLISIESPKELKVQLKDLLCEEYRDLFSTSVRHEPADETPSDTHMLKDK